MSDILIKNIELPEAGSLVLYVQQDGTVIIPYDYTVRFHPPVMKTTAIGLPEHGDLIDRNELPLTWITDHKLDGHTVVEFEDVKNAPVIVEASE